MNGTVPCPDEVSPADVLAVHQLYGKQSHAIDSGRAEDWAATFTPDGEFHSPSYPEPACGTAQLTAFAERFHTDCRARGEVVRHVLSTVHVRRGSPGTLRSRAYLQIVGTPAGEPVRVHRITVLDDDFSQTADGWRIRHRTVYPDR